MAALAFNDGECDAITLDPARVHGGASKIMGLMSIIANHLGKYGGEIPPNFDGRQMTMDIAEVSFPAEDVQCCEPYFPGVIRDSSRCSQEKDHEPVSELEINGQDPITRHFPPEVVRDQLREHVEYRLFCDLPGRWSTRQRHKAAVLRSRGILEMVLDMGQAFVELILRRGDLRQIVHDALNHLDRICFSGSRPTVDLRVDQPLVINLVRTSVELWVNDGALIKTRNGTTPLKTVSARVFSGMSVHADVLGPPCAAIQSDLQLIFHTLVGTIVEALKALFGSFSMCTWRLQKKDLDGDW